MSGRVIRLEVLPAEQRAYLVELVAVARRNAPGTNGCEKAPPVSETTGRGQEDRRGPTRAEPRPAA